MVRFYKIMSGFIDQTCQHRREITFILGRLAFECIINVHYLIEKNSGDIFTGYIAHSLRHERRLHDRIKKNIEDRKGIILPIEERMLKPIDASFKKSALSASEITKQIMSPWTDTDLYQRAKTVGLGDAYLYIFAGPSHAVHGSWQDLIEYHLLEDEGGFTPNLEWRHPRPQMLFALCIMGIDMVKNYIFHILGEHAREAFDKLDDLSNRLQLANNFHEKHLSDNTTN